MLTKSKKTASKSAAPAAPRLKLGLPKGSLQDSTFKLFTKAGYRVQVTSRSYYPSIDDPDIECILVRAQEMARYVDNGVIDVGLTGKDWILEQGADVVEIAELRYAKGGLTPVRWVVAVPEDSAIKRTVAMIKTARVIATNTDEAPSLFCMLAVYWNFELKHFLR